MTSQSKVKQMNTNILWNQNTNRTIVNWTDAQCTPRFLENTQNLSLQIIILLQLCTAFHFILYKEKKKEYKDTITSKVRIAPLAATCKNGTCELGHSGDPTLSCASNKIKMAAIVRGTDESPKTPSNKLNDYKRSVN